jgi:hypothetical protein
MAHWYKEVLGFAIRLSGGDSEKAVAFITDADNKVMLELGKLPGVNPLKNDTTHHLQLHIALKSENPDEDAKSLVQKGAVLRYSEAGQGSRDIFLYLTTLTCFDTFPAFDSSRTT